VSELEGVVFNAQKPKKKKKKKKPHEKNSAPRPCGSRTFVSLHCQMAQQYADAGEILEKLKAGQGSFKNLLYGTKRSVPIPALYALVTETLKCT
jgi:hypothetical protein